MTKSYASPAMDQSNSGCPPEVDFDLWHEWYDPLLRLCCEFEGSTCHFDTELYSNTSWLRVCRYVEPGVDCVLASVGRSPASHAGVGVGVGVGAGVGVGEKPETTRPNQDAAAAFSQVCSKRVVAVGTMSGKESEDPEILPEEPEVLSSVEPEVLSSPEFWTAGLDGPVSAPPPPIPVPGDLTPAVKASKAQQRREAEELARTDEPWAKQTTISGGAGSLL